MLTLTQFQQIFPNAKQELFDSLTKFIPIYQINSLVMFLSQISVESSQLTIFEENLMYSAHALLATWPSHFDVALAASYAYQPEKIANRVYANRMGNGLESSGDGWLYRGRGAIQITGKDNYSQLSNYLNKPIDLTVQYLTTPDGIIESACWFWVQIAKVNNYSDRADIPQVTKAINGGYTGLQNRYDEFDRINPLI